MVNQIRFVRGEAKGAGVGSLGSALAVLGFAIVGLACSDSNGSDGGTGGTAGTGGGGTAGTGGGGASPGEQVGVFSVRLIDPEQTPPGATNVEGRVREGPLLAPDGFVWTELAREGDCVLREPDAPFCNPRCVSPEKCVAENTCAADPQIRSVGTVTVQGLNTADGATTFDMNPQSENNPIYQPMGVSINYPPCNAGDTVSLSASGDVYAGFSTQTTCIEQLVVTNTGDIVVQPDTPTVLTWNAPAQTASRIIVAVDISHHGGQEGQIDCDAPDTGTLEIPASLITWLINLGTAGFPDVIIARRSVGSAPLDHGTVDFMMSSSVTRMYASPASAFSLGRWCWCKSAMASMSVRYFS